MGFSGVLLATPVFADEEEESFEGRSCAVSAECGKLRCIDERCRDVASLVRGEAPKWSESLGHRAWFGDGRGYGALIAAVDIAATLTEPFLMLATVSNGGSTSSTLGVLCFVPTTLAGSTVHFVHRRAVPGIISFFAWPSLAGTTFVVGGLFGLALQHGFEFNSAAAWTAGLTFGGGGAALLTWLDVWMARTVTTAEKRWLPPVQLTSGVVPTRGGAVVSLGAMW